MAIIIVKKNKKKILKINTVTIGKMKICRLPEKMTGVVI